MATAFVNVMEEEGEFIVQLSLPKVDPEMIDIFLDERGVHVQAAKEEFVTESVTNGVYATDSIHAAIARYIPLPVCADTFKAEAMYENDILSIHVPKKSDKKRKQLNIK